MMKNKQKNKAKSLILHVYIIQRVQYYLAWYHCTMILYNYEYSLTIQMIVYWREEAVLVE